MFPVENHIIKEKQQVTFSAVIKKKPKPKTTQNKFWNITEFICQKEKKYTSSNSMK